MGAGMMGGSNSADSMAGGMTPGSGGPDAHPSRAALLGLAGPLVAILFLYREPRARGHAEGTDRHGREWSRSSARPGVQPSGVAVEFAIPEVVLDADAVRLRQVLVNLLSNAAQAGARHVTVSGEVHDGFARVVVEDDGPGVDPALRDRLFEPFATGRAQGTGLGLAISRQIAERHGGSLRLIPSAGSGAAFELRLPLDGERTSEARRLRRRPFEGSTRRCGLR